MNSPRESMGTDASVIVTEENEVSPHSIEKISHFIEVGFLLDANNFRLLNHFTEKTYESQMKKYLFELQDPLFNHQMNDLQAKIKQ